MKGWGPGSFCTNNQVVKTQEGEKLISWLLQIVLLSCTSVCTLQQQLVPFSICFPRYLNILLDILLRAGQALKLPEYPLDWITTVDIPYWYHSKTELGRGWGEEVFLFCARSSFPEKVGCSGSLSIQLWLASGMRRATCWAVTLQCADNKVVAIEQSILCSSFF